MAIINIKIKDGGNFTTLEVGEHSFEAGEELLVESSSGQEIAYAVCGKAESKSNGNEESADKNTASYVFIRKLSDKDRERLAQLSKEAKTYLLECQNKIEKFSLPMQLLDADLSFDEKKLTFYFTAPSRVDFRVLVSDLAHTFKKIIRLQQVGARDEARYLGGVGRCGQQLCCKRFLKGNLESVTLDMAAEQNLAQMGSNRVTGVCGKLICCLKYELAEYREIKKQMPAIGQKVKTKQGSGEVISHNVVKKSYSTRLDDGKIIEVPLK